MLWILWDFDANVILSRFVLLSFDFCLFSGILISKRRPFRKTGKDKVERISRRTTSQCFSRSTTKRSHDFTRDASRFIGTRYIPNKSFVFDVNVYAICKYDSTAPRRAIWSNSTSVLFSREKSTDDATRVIATSIIVSVVVIFLNRKRRNSRSGSRNSMTFARHFPLLYQIRSTACRTNPPWTEGKSRGYDWKSVW